MSGVNGSREVQRQEDRSQTWRPHRDFPEYKALCPRAPTPASPLWSWGFWDGSPTAVSIAELIWEKNFLPPDCLGPGFHPSGHCADRLGEVSALRISWLRLRLSLGWSRWRKTFPFQIQLNDVLYCYSCNYFYNTQCTWTKIHVDHKQESRRRQWGTTPRPTWYLLKGPLSDPLDPTSENLSCHHPRNCHL